MLFSIIIRNYKIYQNINYIPISNGKNFSALIGENGAGKSSILEALNSYFNNTEWNLNHSLSKGFSEREPFICPIFLIAKENYNLGIKSKQVAEKLSNIVWAADKENFNSANRNIGAIFCKHRDALESEGINKNTHYLLPIGIIKRSSTSPIEAYSSIFETMEDDIFGDPINIIEKPEANDLYSQLISYYRYVYIPSEVDFHLYTKIEGKTIQALLGKKLDEIVRSFIPKKTVAQINRHLTDFLDEISSTLGNYEYKKPAKKQNLFNHSHFTEKVIEAFFDSKVLSKIDEKNSVPVYNLSSGEKRKALIDVAKSFLLRAEQGTTQQTILAIDEPELSLHVSSCFEQFEKLKTIAEANVQTIITTHWYGFMPVISNGTAAYISKSKGEIPLIDLRCFRDDIRKLKESSSGKLPTEIDLKGINDLVQSIIASVTGGSYRWIICEGSSDKIYLENYFQGQRKPYILPVGASKNVKRFYQYITMALEQERDDIKGRIFFLLDTDKKYEKFEAHDNIRQIRIRRLLNSSTEKITKLESTTNNDYYPPTEIEDTLDPYIFLKTLHHFQQENELKSIFDKFEEPFKIKNKSHPASISLNLRDDDKLVLEELFNQPKFKIRFALKYVEFCSEPQTPPWIEEIKNFLYPPRPRALSRKPK